MKELLLLWIYLDLFPLLTAVHFLGGTITWKPVNASATGSPIAVAITQTYSWTYSYMSCSNSLIGSSGYIPSYAGVSSETLDCISNCGSSSAGYSSISVLPRCTDFSTSVDTSVAQRTDIVNLSANDDFWVAFQDSAWRPLQTASSADWSIAAHINLQKRSDTGLYNNAPVATMMSPINIPKNTPTVIQIPVGDADGDDLRCRWSTKSGGVDECGDVCPPGSLPSGTVIYPNCTMVITGTILDAWYAVTVMVSFISLSSSNLVCVYVGRRFHEHIQYNSIEFSTRSVSCSCCCTTHMSHTTTNHWYTRRTILYRHWCGSNFSITNLCSKLLSFTCRYSRYCHTFIYEYD